MKFDPQQHPRRSIRLKNYDYASEGAYYVTMVTEGRECLFGVVKNNDMNLNEAGQMIIKWCNELPNKFPNMVLGEFVVMPNHFHGIILIEKTVGADLRVCPDDENMPVQMGEQVGYAATETRCTLIADNTMVQNDDNKCIHPRCKTIGLEAICRKIMATKLL